MNHEQSPLTATLLDAFGGFLLRNGRARSTCAKYRQALTEFNDWLAYRAPGSLTEGEVDQFLAGWWEAFERRNGRKPANATYRAQITALKGFYAYLDRSGNLVDDTRAASPEPAQADRYAKAGKTADRPPE